VNPAQLLGCQELFRTQRPGYGYFRVPKMFFNMVVVRQVDNLELRKIRPQFSRKPPWGVPQFETMVKDD
jgi:hypothetical protein